MFGLSEEERKKKKEREATRERVRRYRERKKGVTEPVTEAVTKKTAPVTDSKFICNCRYFVMKDGQLVCSRCGKPPSKKVETKEAK